MRFGNFGLDSDLKAALEDDAAYLRSHGYDSASEGRKLQISEALSLRWNAGSREICEIRTEVLEIDRRAVELRTYIPGVDGGDRYIVWVHGGGWNEGSLDIYDRVMRVLANAAGCPVVGVGYTKVPLARYPAQIDQLMGAYKHIDQSIFPYRTIRNVAGFSAGANLIMSSFSKYEDQLGTRYFDRACLVCGVFDCDFSTPSYERYDGFFGNSKERLYGILEDYAPGAISRRDSIVFPVNRNQKVCQRFLIMSAEHDMLRSDSDNLAQNFRDRGIETIHHCVPDVTHIFLQRSKSVEVARRAIVEMGEYFASQSNS